MKGVHVIRHVLRLEPTNSSQIGFTAIFDPEMDQVTLTGANGSLAVRMDRIEEVEHLLDKAKELRDRGGWVEDF